MSYDGGVAGAGGPQEPFVVPQHEQQPAVLAASPDVGEPTEPRTMTENAGKLNSKASVFSQVGRGLKTVARIPATLVGVPLWAAGAIACVPMVLFFAAINVARANLFATIGHGIGKVADWVNKEKDEKTISSEPKLSRADSLRNKGITFGEQGVFVGGAICIAIPLIVGLLGRGALQFGIGEEMYNSTFKKAEDGVDKIMNNLFFIPQPKMLRKHETERRESVADLEDKGEVAAAALTHDIEADVDQISGYGAASFLNKLKSEHEGLKTIVNWTVDQGGGLSFVAEGTVDAGKKAIEMIRKQTNLPLPSLCLGEYSESGKVWLRITDGDDIMKLSNLRWYSDR